MFAPQPGGRYVNQPPQQQYQAYSNPAHYPPQNYQQPNVQRGNQAGYPYQYNAALMQPPSLNQEEALDTNSQMYQQRGPMTQSNNEQSDYDTYHQQEEDPMWTHEAQIASMFWEQRCMTMLERFQWFYERFQILRNDHITLNEEMQKMDSEEEWHVFQQHHEEFHEKIEEMEQELSAVVGQNEQLIQQRPTQDNESVWEQRYQELLGNFKSLQEEMGQMQANGGQGGVPQEQYRQLEQHCSELEYQYEQAFNELKMHREGGYSAEIQNQMQAYMQEIQAYKDKLNSLHGENVELQKMLGEFQAENQQLKQERYKANLDRNKIEELIYQVEVKEQEIQSLQQEFKNRNASKVANTGMYEETIQQQRKEIDVLRQQVKEKTSEISQLESSSRLKDELERSKKIQDKKVAELSQEIAGLKAEASKNTEFSSKIQNLQRKLTYSNQEIASLNETLKKKNQELIELRSLSYQVQKLKEAQSDLVRAADERDRLSDSLRKKQQEIDRLHTEVEQLSSLISQANSKRQEFSTRNLRSEIQDLTDQLRRYEGEFNKLKGIINLKEEYNSKMEEENRQTREKVILLENLLEEQRERWREKEIKLSTKGNDYNQRIRALDYEFNLQLKETLEKEVVALRRQNNDRQEALRAYQEKELHYLSRLSVYENQESNYNRDLALQKQKEKSLQVSLDNQLKRYRELQIALKVKDEQIASQQQKVRESMQQISMLNLQIDQDENLIKAKGKAIRELQDQLNQSVLRNSETDKLKVENARLLMSIQNMQRQLAKEESPLTKSKALSVVHSRKNLQSNEQFISQLCRENETLKEEIAKLLGRYTDNKHYSGTIDSRHNTYDLNRRLNEFNQKLQMTIGGASCQAEQLSRTDSKKTVALWEKERQQLINHYEGQLESLKEQLEGRLAGSQASNGQLANSRRNFLGGLETDRLREQVDFLRQKSQEQEERNKHLITVNEDLREKIDSVIKLKQNPSTLDYYKEQLQVTQAEKEALKDRLKKLAEENREFKLELTAKNTKSAQESQFKIFQLELLIQEQQRRITLLQGEKAAADSEKATLQHDFNVRGFGKVKQQEEVVVNVVVSSPKSNASKPSVQSNKQSMQQQFGSVLGNLGYGYEVSPQASINTSGVRVQGSRYHR